MTLSEELLQRIKQALEEANGQEYLIPKQVLSVEFEVPKPSEETISAQQWMDFIYTPSAVTGSTIYGVAQDVYAEAMKTAQQDLAMEDAVRGWTDTLTEPESSVSWHVVCPECGMYAHDQKVFTLIIHLNDKHNWTREQIADWLDESGLDVTIASE